MLKEEDYTFVYKISQERSQVQRILCLKELENTIKILSDRLLTYENTQAQLRAKLQ